MKASYTHGSMPGKTPLLLSDRRKSSSSPSLLWPDGSLRPLVQRHQPWESSPCVPSTCHLTSNPWGNVRVLGKRSWWTLTGYSFYKILPWRFAPRTPKAIVLWVCSYLPGLFVISLMLNLWSSHDETTAPALVPSVLLLISLSKESEKEKQTKERVKKKGGSYS